MHELSNPLEPDEFADMWKEQVFRWTSFSLDSIKVPYLQRNENLFYNIVVIYGANFGLSYMLNLIILFLYVQCFSELNTQLFVKPHNFDPETDHRFNLYILKVRFPYFQTEQGGSFSPVFHEKSTPPDQCSLLVAA